MHEVVFKGTVLSQTQKIDSKAGATVRQSFFRPGERWARWLTTFLLFVSVTVQAENGRVEGAVPVEDTMRIETGIAAKCLDIQIEEDIECYKDAIHRFLQSWLIAWGRGNFQRYLDHYVPGNSPDPGISAAAWEDERREMIAGKAGTEISLELESMMVNEVGVTEVIFTQTCQSPNCSDPVLKKLTLVRSGNTFRIQRELKFPLPGVGIDTK